MKEREREREPKAKAEGQGRRPVVRGVLRLDFNSRGMERGSLLALRILRGVRVGRDKRDHARCARLRAMREITRDACFLRAHCAFCRALGASRRVLLRAFCAHYARSARVTRVLRALRALFACYARYARSARVARITRLLRLLRIMRELRALCALCAL